MRPAAAIAAAAVVLAVLAAPPAPARPPVAWVAIPPTAEPHLVAWGGIEEARSWARRRAGTVGFAVLRPGGAVRGVQIDRRFPSASVVKAMLALAVVRDARHRRLTTSERALLGPMITVSDNNAASTVYRRVGGAGLRSVARAAHMTRFADVGNWADAQITAGDQARLFLRIDRLAPRRHRAYLRHLLGSIISSQRWGIAPVGKQRGFAIMFKGGWRTAIAHQVALLQRDGTRVSLAVLTSGSPSDAYGRETEAGIAARVLSRLPRRRVGGGS
jgi:beta-lactamase class A